MSSLPARCPVIRAIFAVVFAAAGAGWAAWGHAEDRLGLAPGDRVVIAGNAFAERMMLHGYFEALLHAAYPEHRLVIRNLGWSGDEVDLMPRPRNFGTLHEHLGWEKADVVFLCFGMNESFAGEDGLDAWEDRLDGFLEALASERFDGETSPKLVLVSPIAHEDLGAPFPTGDAVVARNRALGEYVEVMRRVAGRREVLFVDLFNETGAFMGLEGAPDLTMNGIHLDNKGYYVVSQMMARLLGLIERPGGGDPSADSDAEKLRRLIWEKNRMHFLAWRPLNSCYIWGERAWTWQAAEPMRELEQIGDIVRQLDEAIWAAPKPPPAAVWATPPTDEEVWEAPLDHGRFEIPAAPRRLESVRRNGALEKGQQ